PPTASPPSTCPQDRPSRQLPRPPTARRRRSLPRRPLLVPSPRPTGTTSSPRSSPPLPDAPDRPDPPSGRPLLPSPCYPATISLYRSVIPAAAKYSRRAPHPRIKTLSNCAVI